LLNHDYLTQVSTQPYSDHLYYMVLKHLKFTVRYTDHCLKQNLKYFHLLWDFLQTAETKFITEIKKNRMN